MWLELQANETILFFIEAEISLGDRVRSLNLEGPGRKHCPFFFCIWRCWLSWFVHPIRKPLDMDMDIPAPTYVVVFWVYLTGSRTFWRYYESHMLREHPGNLQPELESVTSFMELWNTLLSLPPLWLDSWTYGWMGGWMGEWMDGCFTSYEE